MVSTKKKQITEMLSLTIKESIILFHMAFSHSSWRGPIGTFIS